MDCSPTTNSSAFTPAACQVIATIIISVLPRPACSQPVCAPGSPKKPSAWPSAPSGWSTKPQMTPTATPEIAYGSRNGSRNQVPHRCPCVRTAISQAERDRQGDHADHPQQRVGQRPDQVGVAEHRLVVGQPGPHRRVEPVVVGEADVRRPQERQVQQQRDDAGGRQSEQGRRPGHRCGRRGRCELTSAWPSTRPPRPGSSAVLASGHRLGDERAEHLQGLGQRPGPASPRTSG